MICCAGVGQVALRSRLLAAVLAALGLPAFELLPRAAPLHGALHARRPRRMLPTIGDRDRGKRGRGKLHHPPLAAPGTHRCRCLWPACSGADTHFQKTAARAPPLSLGKGLWPTAKGLPRRGPPHCSGTRTRGLRIKASATSYGDGWGFPSTAAANKTAAPRTSVTHVTLPAPPTPGPFFGEAVSTIRRTQCIRVG
jgi:hypothetical protein